jgi:hypothetical protein
METGVGSRICQANHGGCFSERCGKEHMHGQHGSTNFWWDCQEKWTKHMLENKYPLKDLFSISQKDPKKNIPNDIPNRNIQQMVSFP